ncbi:MAG: alpha/beta hydrolase [Deferrisomatales bacterium]|nr:alpha/beta hydrolase [Deferrisomatales bacterium]
MYASQEELDRQFNARGTVADVAPFLAAYRSESAKALASLPCHRDLAYGRGATDTLHVFPVPGVPRAPAFIFLHGGYWRLLSKDDGCFMAETFTRAGAAVVSVDYSLAPAATLPAIVAQVRRAVAWLWRHGEDYGVDRNRLVVAGSSAGGHLAGMVLAGGWQEAAGVPDDVVKGAFGVSGLYDLSLVPRTHVNEWLGLDTATARAMSPLYHLPERGCPLVLAYAEAETDEFKRQSLRYGGAWAARGFPVECFEVFGRNHFDVILDWQDPGAALTRAALGLLHGRPPGGGGAAAVR